MTNKELFIECYNAHLDFEQASGALHAVGIHIDESLLSGAFYSMFDSIMTVALTEDGQTHLYEDILFEEYPLEDALEALEEYFR